MAMKICILLAGRMDPGMGPGTPGISELVRALIHCNDPENEVELIETAVLDQQFPADVTEFDGYLITGSSYSVYQDLAWIHHLMDFIRSAYAANLPMAGICFGHQALAHALGGRVAHSTRGWGAGIRSTKVVSRAAWMAHGKESSLNLLYMHQDQVEMLPPGATLLLEDPFCPLGDSPWERPFSASRDIRSSAMISAGQLSAHDFNESARTLPTPPLKH